MNLILDFDWTLFDGDAVFAKMETARAAAHWKHASLWEHVDASVCFYPDVLEWIAARRERGDGVSILTAYQGPEYSDDAEAFQRIKVERSGISTYVDSVTFMQGLKGDHIEPLLQNDIQNVFLDDTVEQLQSVREAFPDVHCVQMMRSGVERNTDISIPVVTSLAELDAIIERI